MFKGLGAEKKKGHQRAESPDVRTVLKRHFTAQQHFIMFYPSKGHPRGYFFINIFCVYFRGKQSVKLKRN